MIELSYSDGRKGWLSPREDALRRSEPEALQIAHDEMVCEVRPQDLDQWLPDWRLALGDEVQ